MNFKKQVFELTSSRNSIENKFSFLKNTIWSAIENFLYSSEEDVTFASYFRRYKDLYKTDCGNRSDLKKIHLLLSKLGITEHTKFVNYILLRKTCELTFSEAVELLMEFFCPKSSLFHKRWKCLNLTRKEGEDFRLFTSVVNKCCDNFRLTEPCADNIKCLIFMQGLVSTKDAEIRCRVLNKLENESSITLQQIPEDCQRYVSIKQDSKRIRKYATIRNKLSLPLKLMN